jgi:magnesium chelatase family protein
MLARSHSLAHLGAAPHKITIETDIFAGLPGISLVGLPTKSVEESRERLRSAIRNSGLEFPMRKIVLNLAPADLAKHGTGFELAMAIGILAASKQIPSPEKDMFFAAELSLNGDLRPATDTTASMIAAHKVGCKTLVIAADAPPLTEHIKPAIKIVRVQNLNQLYRWLSGQTSEPENHIKTNNVANNTSYIDFSSIRGLHIPKRALEIAAAGNHNVLFVGPPGSGKTLLAHAFASILPPLDADELSEVVYLHGICGQPTPNITARPLRSPHHTASDVALVGGGQVPKPGEVTLAHNGVLFLDELAEFKRSVIEALRQPIEDGLVHISRAQTSLTYPAKFILLAAMNPCPCGYFGSSQQACTCSPANIQRYQGKISGPLLDRFDMRCFISEPSLASPLDKVHDGPSSAAILEKVKQARLMQNGRYKHYAYRSNSAIPNQDLIKMCQTSTEATQLLSTAIKQHRLSQRGATRSLKVSRTIADLANSDNIELEHLSEALQFRHHLTNNSQNLTSPATITG